MILNGTGGCLDRLDYAPFGGQISRSYDCYGGASSEKPLFTGQMRDGESNAGTDTGQDYFNARYLWANIARFTSPDAPFADQRPEDGQSWNLYAYVRNNPLRFVDLTGRTCQKQDDGSVYDDLDGEGCAAVDAENKSLRFSVSVDEDRPEVRDLSAEVSAEHIRRGDEARRRAQREAEEHARDQELSQQSKAVISVAYDRTSHNLECAGLGWVVQGPFMVASAATIPKRISQGGTKNTSGASKALGGLGRGVRTIPSPVGTPGIPQGPTTVFQTIDRADGFAWRMSPSFGRTVGRYLPYVGTVAGAATVGYCLE